MGLIHVTVRIKKDIDAIKGFEEEFLVDTGASDCLVPADRLKEAGIQAIGKTVYELADGEIRELQFGLAIIEFMGEITAGRVIFGPMDTEPILGVTALESVGILIDPVNKTLKRMPAIPLKNLSAWGPC